MSAVGEKVQPLKMALNEKGQVELNFPSAGQYILTLNTPEFKKNGEPEAAIYRTIISLNVIP